MRQRIKNILTGFICSSLVIVLIIFSGSRQKNRPVADLKIAINDDQENYFIDQIEVASLINAENTDYVLGLDIRNLDLKELEARVEKNAFVKDAEVYHDIKGILKVHLIQARPVARILDNNGDRYIDEEGYLLPLNTKHTARVPLIEFEKSPEWEGSITENQFGSDLLNFLNSIDQDAFWNAQVAHIMVNEQNELNMLTQVGKQEVVFGNLKSIESKLKNLEIFYREVLPAKGWNTYSVVNVKFENQIVCK